MRSRERKTGGDAMSDKQAVLEAVRTLPDEASLADIAEQIAIMAAIRRGEEAADAGQVISHEELVRRASTWTKNTK
jgi:predicted transcriptional regulator